MAYSLFKITLLFILLIPKLLLANGVLIDNHHYVENCLTIVNSDAFPGISFVEAQLPRTDYPVYGVSGLKQTDVKKTRNTERRSDREYKRLAPFSRVVSAATCLNNKVNAKLCLFALKSSYLKSKGLKNIDFRHDPNVLKSNIKFAYDKQVSNDNPLKKEWLEYTILGFKDSKLIVFLSKKTELNLLEVRTPHIFGENGTAKKEIYKSYKAVRINSPHESVRHRNRLLAEKNNLTTSKKTTSPKKKFREERVVKIYQAPEIKNLRHSF